MRLPLAAFALSIGLLAGCSGEKTQPKGEVKLEGVTTRKKPVRPWTTAKATKATQPTAKAPPPVGSGVAEQVIKQLNANRARLGLGPLTLNPTLMRVSQDYAVLLAKEGNVNAIPGGKNLPTRIQEAGYMYGNLGTQVFGTRDPATVETVSGFLKQPMMAAGLAAAVDVGIGIATGADGTNYIVIVHGKPMIKM